MGITNCPMHNNDSTSALSCSLIQMMTLNSLGTQEYDLSALTGCTDHLAVFLYIVASQRSRFEDQDKTIYYIVA
jgi:hypothetical protein